MTEKAKARVIRCARFAADVNVGLHLRLIRPGCYEMTTLMLAEFDAETRFRVRAQADTGKAGRGLDLLNKALG